MAELDAPAPRCANGHLIAVGYTLAEARSLEVLVFVCESCDLTWNATAEERDAFLKYLETQPGNAVPS
jgi:hypothetical protein